MSLSAWVEWKSRCAIVLCDESAQAVLYEFATTRFRRYVERYANATNVRQAGVIAANVDDAEAWHRFETHLTVTSTRGGKRYKDWLFARVPRRGSAPRDVIEGGAALLMRNVVREYLAQEFPPPGTVSLSRPVATGRDGAGLTLTDLLAAGASPADETARREYEELARGHAVPLFGELTRRERVALLAKRLGLSLARPEVERVAGCRKSMVNEAYRALVRQVDARVRARYADDGKDAVMALVLLVCEALEKCAFEWGKSERACRNLFMVGDTEDAVT